MTPYPRALEAFPRLRQSTLSTFDECPLTWHFNDKYCRTLNRADAARGTLWHRFMAKVFREMALHGEERIEVDVALAILHETLRQADVPIEEVVACPMSEVADMYWMCKKVASEMTWDVGHMVDVEHRLNTKLYYPDPEGGFVERIFSGQLDVLFAVGENLEHGIVVDHKSGWGLPAPSQISEEGFFQQRGYALLVFENHPSILSVTLREFYPRYSDSREATLYREQLDDLRQEFAGIAERFDRCYEEEVWPTLPGRACAWCPTPTKCPQFPEVRREGKVQNEFDAHKTADQVIVAEASLKSDRAALKAWSKVHGPIAVRDPKGPRQFGFREQVRVNRPTREMMEEAMASGHTDLDKLYQEQTGTRFDRHIPQPPESTPTDDKLLGQLEESVKQAKARLTEEHS